MWIVKLEEGVWIADTDGDPGRTLVRDNAEVFETRQYADDALKAARRLRSFPNALVETK